jgi:serine/threonine protein kinase/class 3 adenylate cyclase/tetratricopeptide (TPR) repeat protein
MSLPTESQWARYSALCARLQSVTASERAAVLQALRAEGHEDSQVLSLVALHWALPPDPARDRTGDRLGDFTLEEPLGAGGMGVVYRAQQRIGSTTRPVAVKLIHPTLLQTAQEEALARFQAEIGTLVKLEHEGIARIYGGGIAEDPHTHEPLPYLAMELVRGGLPITTYARDYALPWQERLGLFLRVCRAVQYAHEHRVIHRDLKPANILVDSEGSPFVIDFGLAHACDALLPGAHLAASGTPAYMSPEQVSDAFGPISAKSDVYALGLILYELLTAQHPYALLRDGTFAQWCQAITEAPPPPLHQYSEVYGGELEEIMAAALAKRPADRIRVDMLRSRLERYLQKLPPDIDRPFHETRKLQRATPTVLERGEGPTGFLRVTPPFVGRRQELAWLEQWLQEAIAGYPRIVLIQGDAGIGKTRLLQEVRSTAVHLGAQACYGRCYEDLALPYLPFAEALRSQLEHFPEDAARILGPDAAIIDQLHLRQGALIAAAGPSLAIQADQDKLRLLLAVSRVIIAQAQKRPTLFVIDDLHWADQPSLELFGHLAFTLAETAVREPAQLLLVGVSRPVEPEERLARLNVRLQREVICQTLVLSGLEESEIRELIRGLGLARPSQQLTATVSEATRGNPLFVQEVFHHLMQQDTLQERGRYLVTTAAPTDLRLPKHMTMAIDARIQRLSEGCRRVLTLAASLGEVFSLEILGVVSGVGEAELLALLEEGMRQRLLLGEGETFRFAHSLIRHVFYHEPSTPRRQRIHQQIAQAMEHLYADSLDQHVLEIAQHVIKAGPVAEVSQVVEYARRAGDQAFTVFAWANAAYYYEAVLSAAGPTGRLSAHDRAELHYLAGLAHYRDQDVGPSLDHYEKAIAAYRLIGDVRGLAPALVEKTRINFTLASVPYGALIDVRPLEEVLEALGEREPGLRGGILANMSHVYYVARQRDKAEEMARRSLVIGQRTQDDRLCTMARIALGMAQSQGLHVREAIESWKNALASARRADDLWLQGWPPPRISQMLIMLGRLHEAEAVALEGGELARKTHHWGNHALGLSALACVAVARGDFAAAEQQAHEAMQMTYRSRYPWGGARSMFALACARTLCGAWVEAQDALDMLIEPGRVFEEAGSVMQGFARIFRQLLRAHADAVNATMEPFGTDLLQVERIDTYSLAPLCALVEIGDLTALPTPVDTPYEILASVAERGVLFSIGWVFLIPRVLGVAATLKRWWDTAEAHFQAAIRAASEVGARPELGRAYLDYARMLVTRGRRGDRSRAIELVGQAAPLFGELGMVPFAQRTAQLAETLRACIPQVPQSRVAPLEGLSEREMEVLLAIAQGHSNREIADRLLLGSQTVVHHMRSIFTKIGVNTRTKAATYALERGLTAQIPPRRLMGPLPEPVHVVGQGRTQALRIILVTDMEGSTALVQRLGDARAYELMRVHNAIIRDCLRAHSGSEVTHTGDGIEASFSLATNAVECAIAIQRAFAKHNQEHPAAPLRVRIGINAGEPIPMEDRLFGAAVHAAFRICARARPGQILVFEVIRQLVAGKGFALTDRGRIALKGFAGRVRLYEVSWERGGP